MGLHRVAAIICGLAVASLACTNMLVTRGASADKSTMISYNADSHTLYGELYHYPHAKHNPGTMVDVVEWDTGEYLGQIEQVAETYNVVGNVNEYQVAIGETTYGGVEILQHQKGAIIDYGSLIYLALQRSKTAREAITVMTSLVAKYGYYSEGESFSIADPVDVWILEMIGKGDFELGAVWVARKIPDGYICSHANQARIQQFPRDDPENCVYSADVVSFARKAGLYTGSDEDFSFSDVYAPVTPGNARGCEGRVWSAFRWAVGDSMDEYIDYIRGENLTHRMPLWVKPNQRLSVNDTMMLMRDHYEGTYFDFRSDVGAGPFGAPYRWRPMDFWKDGKNYVNERATATQQTGWGYVAQLRAWLPNEFGGINWFSVDDTSCTVYFPMYSSATRVPRAFAQGNGAMMSFTFDSAFWAFNLVANFAYNRWSHVYPEVFAKIQELEAQYLAEVPLIDAKAAELIKTSPVAAVEFVTAYSEKTGNALQATWMEFFKFLFTRFMDGNTKAPNPGHRDPTVEWPGYPTSWYDRIIEETGEHYHVPNATVAERKRHF